MYLDTLDHLLENLNLSILIFDLSHLVHLLLLLLLPLLGQHASQLIYLFVELAIDHSDLIDFSDFSFEIRLYLIQLLMKTFELLIECLFLSLNLLLHLL